MIEVPLSSLLYSLWRYTCLIHEMIVVQSTASQCNGPDCCLCTFKRAIKHFISLVQQAKCILNAMPCSRETAIENPFRGTENSVGPLECVHEVGFLIKSSITNENKRKVLLNTIIMASRGVPQGYCQAFSRRNCLPPRILGQVRPDKLKKPVKGLRCHTKEFVEFFSVMCP
ncbi:putative galacturonosyltransferase-like 8 [Frankliniella fusca]|uniref:Galacturonosyltransferase-like 8 n=1 Tax=Frankliniella fusca TaxID=407009 RepID=A0AAE1I439_9NEOP|nr:putative galacturonosyltransferase-like 8 [Frankliniella fusca]